jgi:hypothetical protein
LNTAVTFTRSRHTAMHLPCFVATVKIHSPHMLCKDPAGRAALV